MLWNYLSKAVASFILVLTLSQIGFSQGPTWRTNGNTGTNSTTNFLGTIDNISLVFRTNNLQRLWITNSGNVGIGTSTPTSPLTVTGLIETTGIGTGGIRFPNGTIQSIAGVTSVTASGPLSSSGGLTPIISLTGIVGTGNGGTGLSSAGVAGSFLRSTGAGWTSAPLNLNGTLSGDGTSGNPLRVTNQGIDTAHLSDNSVTIEKIDASSPSPGRVLTTDGITMFWSQPPSSAPSGLVQVDTFTTSSTWTMPSGCNRVFVIVVGGGGAGGGSIFAPGGAGGGAGGGYSQKWITSGLTPTVAVTVGLGGIGYEGATGGVGGTSSFGTFVSATGGSGGDPSFPTFSGGTGGIGIGGDLNLVGRNGQDGGMSTVAGGGDTAMGYGFGATPRSKTDGDGNPGINYGGGGGGGFSNGAYQTGGPGTGGVVIVYCYP